jgi:hypothetical protein
LIIPLVQSEEWQSYESEHFIFFYQEDHLTLEEMAVIAETQEALFTRITTLLHIEYTGKITYYLYGNRSDFEGIPGAYTVGSEIRYLCVFCVDFCKNGLNDAHEMTHALDITMGSQYGFLAEGLAVYVEDYVINDVNLHGIIKVLYTENRLTPLEDLVEDFWCDILYNYDIVGSFTAFLIEEYGIEQFKWLYSKPLGFSPYLEVYKKSLEELEAEWISVIQKADVTEKEERIVRYRDGIKEGLAIYFDMGFTSFEYATYPAKAEEGICLFREYAEEDFEKAFLYLDQFNQGMKAWKEAAATFEQALEHTDYQTKADLFKKAASLYETAGDESMLILSEKYRSAYQSLVDIERNLEQGNDILVNQEIERVRPLLEELEEESELSMIGQYSQAKRDQVQPGFEAGSVLILTCVLIVMHIVKR